LTKSTDPLQYSQSSIDIEAELPQTIISPPCPQPKSINTSVEIGIDDQQQFVEANIVKKQVRFSVIY
jgi:hypothetical protein